MSSPRNAPRPILDIGSSPYLVLELGNRWLLSQTEQSISPCSNAWYEWKMRLGFHCQVVRGLTAEVLNGDLPPASLGARVGLTCASRASWRIWQAIGRRGCLINPQMRVAFDEKLATWWCPFAYRTS